MVHNNFSYVIFRYATHSRAVTAVFITWLYVMGLVGSVLILDRRHFTLFIVFTTYVIPVTIMLVSYVAIGYVAMQHARQLNKWDNTGLRLHHPACSHDAMSHNNPEKANRGTGPHLGVGGKTLGVSRELKAALRILLIVGMFVGAWTPFMALNIRHYVCGGTCELDPRLLKYFKLLHYANSSLNPVLFIMLNSRWRAAFFMALCRPNVKSHQSYHTISNNLGWS